MREIKFRILHKASNTIADDVTSGSNESLNELLSCEEIICLQYTGLKDKNGVEIYDGNILAIKLSDSESEVIHNYEVRFKIGSFVLYNIDKFRNKWGNLSRMFDPDMFDILEAIEVIGNIYEDKELLND